MKKVLLIESEKSYNRLIVSGSYWFRVEMAYGFYKLGWVPYLVQHPLYDFFPWIKRFSWGNVSNKKLMEDGLDEFDLILVLEEPNFLNEPINVDAPVIYWDIEGFPPEESFFSSLLNDLQEKDYRYYGAKFSSIRDVVRKYYYHFKNQKLRWWDPVLYFSAAKRPLIKASSYLPLGAEPELYDIKDVVERDINLSIIGYTSRWFMGRERIGLAEKILAELDYPLAYWYGSYPEKDNHHLPKNAHSGGHVDFFSLRYFLQRSKYVVHVPRPYHLQTQCHSATIFQAAAAGAIPIHAFNGLETLGIGYYYKNVENLEDLSLKSYPEDFTYHFKFEKILKEIS